MELGRFNINYQPQTTVKVQALADFIVYCTYGKKMRITHNLKLDYMNQKNKFYLMLHINKSSTIRGCGDRMILSNPEDIVAEYIPEM